MDREGSSGHTGSGDDVPPPPARRQAKRVDELEITPENIFAISERDFKEQQEEEARAEASGQKMFPAAIWNRLKNPPSDRPSIDVWEFKQETSEYLTMTMVCDGEKYPMYFGSRTALDYEKRQNVWIPRGNQMYKSLATRLFSIPKTMTVNKVVFYSTPQCEIEDCIIELMYMKKWSCKQLEYTITTEFTQPQHLRKLIHMLKPSDITIFLNYGPYQQQTSNHDTSGMHNHLAVDLDGILYLERDFRVDCAQALNAAVNDTTKRELAHLYGEAGRGKASGAQMLRTLCSLRKFVSMMAEKQMAQTKGMGVRKFVVHGPSSSDKMCPKLQTLLKEDGMEEATRKKSAYANGDQVFVCVRNDLRRQFKYSLSMPSTYFKMNVGNEQLLLFTKSVPNFQCFFRTTVDEQGVQQLISEWLKGDRNVEEIQLHVDKVFDPDFAVQFNPDITDQKRIKIRKTSHERRWTMYIEKERLFTRHLSIRVLEH